MSQLFFANAEFSENDEYQPLIVDGSTITIGDESFICKVIQEYPAKYELTSSKSGSIIVHATVYAGFIELSLNGYTYQIRLLDEKQHHFSAILKSGSDAKKSVVKLNAPMPGLLKQINIVEGQTIRKGESLFILEAMKMENSIKSPCAGIITKAPITAGNAVEKGALLCMINPA